MGESIAEGTIVRWMKKVGDAVDRDEPLFEISTDKVDAEIPSPVAGVVTEIRAGEGETVPVNSVVAVIGSAPASARAADSGPERRVQPPAEIGVPPAPPAPAPPPAPEPLPAHPAPPPQPRVSADESVEGRLRLRSSPLVRKIAAEHRIDISEIRGTGIAGRVTKNDILAFIAARSGAPAPKPSAAAARPGPIARTAVTPSSPEARQATGAGLAGQVVPMSVMRRKIAEHMTASKRTSAHVHSVFEVNFSRVAHIREAKRADFERAGAKLTYLTFILKAAADALGAVPVVNASVEGDSIVYHKEVHVGIAVALDWGLIVPVVKHADQKDLLELSRAVADLASRARNKQLKPDEVSGGTFTITNPGGFGAQFGMPIINQPQVAILGVGAVEKRPIVIDDAIAIRPMAYLSLGYDHRIVDGAVADAFMSRIKGALESWNLSAV
jgi:2-oxoglutarate dehydrogenase E2 component (dihydrolipoamide succinyltransferase)